eukprot:TRINITY_DN34467_c0_g2_i1.p1 TRINITY_DN34467_c0_g2~~TRINITY_DN34467_c0_g2_i1.p1  ORF type:complete len:182 (-),score=27.69 TRINITY_DN34467_c0_g2_i1:505-1050(-)
MTGLPPYTDQYHVNQCLNYRRGADPQTGDFGVRWSTVPDIQCIWSEPSSEDEMVQAAFHHAVSTRDKATLLADVRERVMKYQAIGGLQPPLKLDKAVCDTWKQKLRTLTVQIASLREEFVTASAVPEDVQLQVEGLREEVMALSALACMRNGRRAAAMPDLDKRAGAGREDAEPMVWEVVT